MVVCDSYLEWLLGNQIFKLNWFLNFAEICWILEICWVKSWMVFLRKSGEYLNNGNNNDSMG